MGFVPDMCQGLCCDGDSLLPRHCTFSWHLFAWLAHAAPLATYGLRRFGRLPSEGMQDAYRRTKQRQQPTKDERNDGRANGKPNALLG